MALTSFETWRRNRVALNEAGPPPVTYTSPQNPNKPTHSPLWAKMVLSGLLAARVGSYFMQKPATTPAAPSPAPTAPSPAPTKPADPEPPTNSRGEFATKKEAIEARVKWLKSMGATDDELIIFDAQGRNVDEARENGLWAWVTGKIDPSKKTNNLNHWGTLQPVWRVAMPMADGAMHWEYTFVGANARLPRATPRRP